MGSHLPQLVQVGALAPWPWMQPTAPHPVLYFIFLCFQRGLCILLVAASKLPFDCATVGLLKNFILLGNSHLVALKSKPLWLAPGPPLTDLFEKRLRWHPALLNMPPGKAV